MHRFLMFSSTKHKHHTNMKGSNMKQKTLIALLLGIGISAGSIALAQEVPAQTVSDAGVEAVREAQETTAPVPQKKMTPAKVLKSIAKEKKWSEGWDAKKRRYITIVSETVNSTNPATDADFFIKREAAARRAYLSAKAEIIEFCNTEMDAKDMLFVPGTDINAVFDKELKEIEANLVEEKEKLAKILDRYDRAEAAQLRGTTFADRLDDLIVAIIKKLDEEYNAGANDEKLKAELEAAKKNVEEQKAKVRKIEQEAEALKGSLVQEQSSAISTMASMPLYGATVLMQVEGFDEKYSVAMIVVWSEALERAARAIVTGEPFKLTPKPDATKLDDWVEKQNLASMIGPRTFLDQDGSRWFIGISAAEYNDDMGSVAQRRAKTFAEQFAKSATAFSVMGDVESYKSAQMLTKTYQNGKAPEQEKAVMATEEKISQTLENKTIRGLQKVASDTVDHPITDREMYVAVYAIDSTSAQDALAIEKENYSTKIQQERYQTIEKGRNAVNQAAVEAAKNRPEDFKKGASEQSQALSQELEKRESEKQGAGINIKPTTPSTKPTKPTEPNKGIFGGDSDVSDDF